MNLLLQKDLFWVFCLFALSTVFDLSNAQTANCDETNLLNQHPDLAQVTYNAAVNAAGMTIALYGSKVEGQQSDAFQHSNWNVEIIRLIYQNPNVTTWDVSTLASCALWAKAYTDAHECTSNSACCPTQVPEQTIMDLHNNYFGQWWMQYQSTPLQSQTYYATLLKAQINNARWFNKSTPYAVQCYPNTTAAIFDPNPSLADTYETDDCLAYGNILQVSSNSPISRTFHSTTDIDFVSFCAETGQSYNISTSISTSMVLYDGSNMQIGLTTGTSMTWSGTTQTVKVKFTNPTPSTANYTIAVSGYFCGQVPSSSPSPSPSRTPSASVQPSRTPSPSSSPSTGASASTTPSVTPTRSPTPSVTPSSSSTPVPSVTPTTTPTRTPTPTTTPSPEATDCVGTYPSCSGRNTSVLPFGPLSSETISVSLFRSQLTTDGELNTNLTFLDPSGNLVYTITLLHIQEYLYNPVPVNNSNSNIDNSPRCFPVTQFDEQSVTSYQAKSQQSETASLQLDVVTGNCAQIRLWNFLYDNPANLTVGESVLSIPPSAWKLAFNISNWPFVNTGNSLRVIFRVTTSIPISSQEISFNPQYPLNVDKLQLTDSEGRVYTLNFLQVATADGQTVPCAPQVQFLGSLSPLVVDLVLDFPYFEEYLYYDPDFSVLVEGDEDSSNDTKDDGVPKQAYIIAGSVAGAAVLAGFVAATVLAKRKRSRNRQRMQVAQGRLQEQSSIENNSYASMNSVLGKVEAKSPENSVISMSDLSLRNTQS